MAEARARLRRRRELLAALDVDFDEPATWPADPAEGGRVMRWDFENMTEAELDAYIAESQARLAAKREFLDRILPLMGPGDVVDDALDRMTPQQRIEVEALQAIAYPGDVIQVRGDGR